MIIEPEFVAMHWPLSGVAIGQSFHSYPTRRVFVVRSDQGTYVAKVARTPQLEADSFRAPSVLEHLKQRGFEHAPALLRTRSDEQIVQNGDQTICMLEYIPEVIREVDGDEERTWRELGSVAGRLNAVPDCPYPFAIPTGAALSEISRWMQGRPFEGRFLALRGRLEELTLSGPTGLIHTEINLNHARRRADGIVVLLDWDDAGTGPTVLELGSPLITAFLSEEDLTFHKRPAEAFYRGYVDGGGIPDSARIFSAALFHAFRYMRFGDIDRRWRRIHHALEHEDELCSVLA